MKTLSNIFWLGTKELRAIFRDPILVTLILYSFSFAIISNARGAISGLHNATIAFVDEDHSQLSESLPQAFLSPEFKRPRAIRSQEVEQELNLGRVMFVVVIPPRFEADFRAGRNPEIQVDIDATVNRLAGTGTNEIGNILKNEIARYATKSGAAQPGIVGLVTRIAYNPNREASWFQSIGVFPAELPDFRQAACYRSWPVPTRP